MIDRLLNFLFKLFGFLFGLRKKQPEPDRRYHLVEVPRIGDGSGDSHVLSWKPCHPSTMRRFKAQMTCPRGHGLVLTNHSIDSTGLVQPSVICMTEGCDFHEYVHLKDWNFGPLK